MANTRDVKNEVEEISPEVNTLASRIKRTHIRHLHLAAYEIKRLNGSEVKTLADAFQKAKSLPDDIDFSHVAIKDNNTKGICDLLSAINDNPNHKILPESKLCCIYLLNTLQVEAFVGAKGHLKESAIKLAELFKQLTRVNFIVRIPNEAHRLFRLHGLFEKIPMLPPSRKSDANDLIISARSNNSRNRRSQQLSSAGFSIVNNFSRNLNLDNKPHTEEKPLKSINYRRMTTLK